ncbi:hypothetical protein GALL_432570 [mine drainage metagenome]|uniref:Uncharacterized protein n=1 Tax=mine drainage metagenome TaxID=410659 RepID=A0A1J5PUD9_9ZZZZ
MNQIGALQGIDQALSHAPACFILGQHLQDASDDWAGFISVKKCLTLTVAVKQSAVGIEAKHMLFMILRFDQSEWISLGESGNIFTNPVAVGSHEQVGSGLQGGDGHQLEAIVSLDKSQRHGRHQPRQFRHHDRQEVGLRGEGVAACAAPSLVSELLVRDDGQWHVEVLVKNVFSLAQQRSWAEGRSGLVSSVF